MVLDEILSVAVDEDGVDPTFAASFNEIIQKHGSLVIDELELVLDRGGVNQEVVEETLILIGSIEHEPTHRARLSILQKFLLSDDVRLRDTAGLGIAALNDSSALNDLRRVAEGEASPRLRRNFALVIDQLERTRECQGSQG